MLVLETRKSREKGVKVVHANPCVGVSHSEERETLERLRENLEEVGGHCGRLLRVDVVDECVDLRMLCRL